MNKENFIELLKKVYSWLIAKGMKATIAKLIIGVLFGAVCAFCFASCSLHYSDHDKEIDVEIFTVEGGQK